MPIKNPRIWIYKMKGRYKICSEKELNMAKCLSSTSKEIFLESRSYIRESLSQFYNCHPLDINLLAPPGKPPLLLGNMEKISISHCKDALMVCLFENRIGVDIERHDRKFDYIGIAKRYFHRNNNFKLSRKKVLSNWTTIEAAIKWDSGKLSEDITSWEIIKDKQIAINREKKISVKINQINFMDWIISLAFNGDNIQSNNIICNNLFD